MKLKRLLIMYFFVLGLFILLNKSIYAQSDSSDAKQSADEIAKILSDPNATIGKLSFPIDFITYAGDLPGAGDQSSWKISFQPGLPYKLGEGMNLFFRPLIPIVLKQPVLNSTGNFENKGVALGDISFDLAVGKSFPSRIMLLGGIVGTAPAATDVSISLRQWLLGPEVFIAYVGNWGVVGVLLTQSWDIGGSNKSSTSITGGQYLYSVNLGNAWQLFSGPSFSYNHNSPDGSKFTFPLGIGVSKTISLGGVPLKIAVEDWYYLAKPDSFGPQNQVRLTLTPVVPLPW